MKKDEKTIREIIKKYGSTIDLKKNPFIITEIINKYGPKADDIPDGGTPCGGVPNPPPPPNPSKADGIIDHSDVMKEVLKVSREVALVAKELKSISAKIGKR